MIINVIGLGESVSEYKPDGNVTIGVNDAYRYHKTDYLILIDPPERFDEPDRYKTIIESTPKKFYSNRIWPVNNFELIVLNIIRGDCTRLDEEPFCYSNNSPFVACVLAYKLGAKVINLYGADFTSHKVLSNEHSMKRVLNDFDNLYNEFLERGVSLRVTKQSQLSRILPPISG